MDEKLKEQVLGNVEEIKADGTVSGLATRLEVDRDGDVIDPMGANLKPFLKNPVLLWSHQRMVPPVGTVLEIEARKKDMPFTAKLSSATQLARDVRLLLEEKTLNAFSIGFRAKRDGVSEEPMLTGQEGFTFKAWELVELSVVSVPSNRGALQRTADDGNDTALKILKTFYGLDDETRIPPEQLTAQRCIPYAKADLADPEAVWVASKVFQRAALEDMKAACAWHEMDKANHKQAYWLMHHDPESGMANKYALMECMVALFGGKGSTPIPGSDRRLVYGHLAQHYEDFKMTPPTYQGLDLDEQGDDVFATLGISGLEWQHGEKLHVEINQMEKRLKTANSIFRHWQKQDSELPPTLMALMKDVAKCISPMIKEADPPSAEPQPGNEGLTDEQKAKLAETLSGITGTLKDAEQARPAAIEAAIAGTVPTGT